MNQQPEAYKRFYQNYLRRNQKDQARMVESWKFFSGLYHGQWNESAVMQLEAEGRPITSFNFIQNKVLNLAGSFSVNQFETKYTADIGRSEDEAALIQELYLMDRDRCGLKIERMQFLLSFLIHTGVLEIYKDYRHSPFGNVGFRYRDKTKMFTDPDWSTFNVNDNKRIFLHDFYDAEQIVDMYGRKNGEVGDAYERIKSLIDDPADRTSEVDKIADRSPEYFDSISNKYKVIECVEMKTVDRAQIYNIRTGDWLPVMAEKVARARMRMPGSEDLRLLPRRFKECWRYTTCPALGKELELENGPDSLQIEQYPYFFGSALNLNGERQGIVDPLKDPQATYNKREATMTHWQMTSANGVEFVEENAMSDEEWERYKRTGNKPGTKFRVAEGANKDKRIMIKDRGIPPSDLWTSGDRAVAMADRIYAPASATGGEGKSGESGKLFNEKKTQALLALQPMEEVLMDVERQMGEAYFLAAKQVYSGVPREIKSKVNNNVIRLNIPTPNGTINDISRIERVNLTISQSPESKSIKEDRLNIFSQVRGQVTSPVSQAILDMKIFEYLPGVSKQDLADAMPLLKKNLAVLEARMDAELAQIRQAQQAASQPGAAQAGPSAPGQTPAEGGGQSMEGKSIPTDAGLPVDARLQNQMG
jgi:hypothetical protein